MLTLKEINDTYNAREPLRKPLSFIMDAFPKLLEIANQLEAASLSRLTKSDVPTFDEVEYKRNDGKDLTALEQFVYDNEPTPESGQDAFRKGLQALIEEVTE